MKLFIGILIFLIIWYVLVQQSMVYEYAKKKGYEGKRIRFIGLIPVFGLLYYRKKESLVKVTDYELKDVFNNEKTIERVVLYFFGTIAFILLFTMIAVFGYLSIKNNALRTIVVTFLVILAFLLNQGLVVDYAAKKGYEGTRVELIASIPIYGAIYFKKKQSIRNTSKLAIKEVFKPSRIFEKIFVYGELTIVATVVLIPIIYIFGMAFSNIQSDVPNQLWPETPTLGAFKYLFDETKFTTWYSNTLSIAVINMLIGTVIITGAAYVFARFSFKGKKAGLLGRPWALSILYIGGSIPGNLWLIKGFLSQIPKDLDESAMIDGANKLQIFFKIILPLSIPILTFVAVSMFMGPWMDYMLPGYLLNIPKTGAEPGYDITQQWTLAVGLFKFINDPTYRHYSAFASGALLVGLPITVLYVVFQKYIIEGVMAGATKG
jgi:arabinogalactan oligomer/maltooligosaccharide transport system permease protein